MSNQQIYYFSTPGRSAKFDLKPIYHYYEYTGKLNKYVDNNCAWWLICLCCVVVFLARLQTGFKRGDVLPAWYMWKDKSELADQDQEPMYKHKKASFNHFALLVFYNILFLLCSFAPYYRERGLVIFWNLTLKNEMTSRGCISLWLLSGLPAVMNIAWTVLFIYPRAILALGFITSFLSSAIELSC